jgi:RNA polymerase sigma-70 factor, ECF subfamily
VPQPAANSLISLRLSDLSTVAEGRADQVTTNAIASMTRRLAAGEDEGFRQLQALYFERLYRFLLVVARGDETQAREALQETFVRVARYARTFEDEDAFWSWLRAVGRNAARDAGRKQRRYSSLLERFIRRNQSDSPAAVQDTALAAALEESVAKLASDDRLLIEGKYVDGQTVRELSEQAGLTEKAVESRLWRLRQQLREDILKKLKTP